LKEKLTLPGDLKIKQDLWNESPCSLCSGTPCCRNLPLTPQTLNSQSDFINLILASCYNGIYPALKKSGEWTVYLGRSCSYLNNADGKCSIHSDPRQSLVCKSYDAHNCWYTDAFRADHYSTMIPFNTQMLVWYEKRYELIKNRFEIIPDWDELCESAFEFRSGLTFFEEDHFEPFSSKKLSFRLSRSQEYLFFPPFQRPEMKSHFELISFRLGFPGTSLAVTDNLWAFMIKSSLNISRLNLVRESYYPSIGHKDGSFSFESIQDVHKPFSQCGDQWIILQKRDLAALKNLTVFDASGRVRRLPTTTELLSALTPGGRPHRAA